MSNTFTIVNQARKSQQEFNDDDFLSNRFKVSIVDSVGNIIVETLRNTGETVSLNTNDTEVNVFFSPINNSKLTIADVKLVGPDGRVFYFRSREVEENEYDNNWFFPFNNDEDRTNAFGRLRQPGTYSVVAVLKDENNNINNPFIPNPFNPAINIPNYYDQYNTPIPPWYYRDQFFNNQQITPFQQQLGLPSPFGQNGVCDNSELKKMAELIKQLNPDETNGAPYGIIRNYFLKIENKVERENCAGKLNKEIIIDGYSKPLSLIELAARELNPTILAFFLCLGYMPPNELTRIHNDILKFKQNLEQLYNSNTGVSLNSDIDRMEEVLRILKQTIRSSGDYCDKRYLTFGPQPFI